MNIISSAAADMIRSRAARAAADKDDGSNIPNIGADLE
jgi:hypothetical protein